LGAAIAQNGFVRTRVGGLLPHTTHLKPDNTIRLEASEEPLGTPNFNARSREINITSMATMDFTVSWSAIMAEMEDRQRTRLLSLSAAEWKEERRRLVKTYRGFDIQDCLSYLAEVDRLRAQAITPRPAARRRDSPFSRDFAFWRDVVEEPYKYGDDTLERWLTLDSKLRAGPGRWRVEAYWFAKDQEEEDRRRAEAEAVEEEERAIQAPFRILYAACAKQAAVAGERAWVKRDIKRHVNRFRAELAAKAAAEGAEERAAQAPFRALYSRCAKEAAWKGERAWVHRDFQRHIAAYHRKVARETKEALLRLPPTVCPGTGRVRCAPGTLVTRGATLCTGCACWVEVEAEEAVKEARRNAAVTTIAAVVRGHQSRSRLLWRDCCMCLSHRVCPLLTGAGRMCRGCAELGPYEEETGPLPDEWNWYRSDFVDLTLPPTD
jgi:hypothetical protein